MTKPVQAQALSLEHLNIIGEQLRALDPLYGELEQPDYLDDGAWEEALCRFQDACYHFQRAVAIVANGDRVRSLNLTHP